RVVSTVEFSTSDITRHDCALSTRTRPSPWQPCNRWNLLHRRQVLAVAAVQPVAVKGLAGISFIGDKFSRNPRVESYRRPTESDLSSPTTSIRYICFATAPNAIDLFAELPSKFYETFAAHFTKRGMYVCMLLKFLLLVGGSVLACLISTTSGSMLRSRRWLGLPPKPRRRCKM
ncbi:hypothetical protein B296_00023185, partial [Ensete ventricosum]